MCLRRAQLATCMELRAGRAGLRGSRHELCARRLDLRPRSPPSLPRGGRVCDSCWALPASSAARAVCALGSSAVLVLCGPF
eukprot:6203892-Pleurochrysis_carterae.AAC.2